MNEFVVPRPPCNVSSSCNVFRRGRCAPPFASRPHTSHPSPLHFASVSRLRLSPPPPPPPPPPQSPPPSAAPSSPPQSSPLAQASGERRRVALLGHRHGFRQNRPCQGSDQRDHGGVDAALWLFHRYGSQGHDGGHALSAASGSAVLRAAYRGLARLIHGAAVVAAVLLRPQPAQADGGRRRSWVGARVVCAAALRRRRAAGAL